jgi:hypothetical protein
MLRYLVYGSFVAFAAFSMLVMVGESDINRILKSGFLFLGGLLFAILFNLLEKTP